MGTKRGGRSKKEQREFARSQRHYAVEKTAILDYQEVADIMTKRGYPMSKNNVCIIEGRALFKIRKLLMGRGEL